MGYLSLWFYIWIVVGWLLILRHRLLYVTSYPCSWIKNLSAKITKYIPKFWERSVKRKSNFRFIRPSGHRCLKNVKTSYDQTRRPHDVWQKTSDLRRLKDVRLTSSWKRPIYDVFKTSNLRRLEDLGFTTSWRRRFTSSRRRSVYDVLKTFNLSRLEDIGFTSSWRRLICDLLRTSVLWRLEDVCKTTSVLQRH